MNATITQPTVPRPGCHAPGTVPPMVASPITGRVRWPSTPMAAQARQAAIVKPTTQGLRRRRASDSAPSTGTETTTRSEEMPLPRAYTEFDAPRSAMSHTEK
jgi:hypothetical protein